MEDLDLIEEPLFSRIVHRLHLLQKFPNLGCPLTGSFSDWRGTAVGLFKIYYQVTARGVEIGYVRHGRRAEPKR